MIHYTYKSPWKCYAYIRDSLSYWNLDILKPESSRWPYEIMEKIWNKKISGACSCSRGAGIYLSLSYYRLPPLCHFCGLGIGTAGLVHSGVWSAIWRRKWRPWRIQTLPKSLQKPLAGIYDLFSGILPWPVELNYSKMRHPKFIYTASLHKPENDERI